MCEIEISHIGKNKGNSDLVCEKKRYGSSHEISVLIAYMQIPLINAILTYQAKIAQS